ncbi:hypothetical protein BRADI_1g28050v3 [Brachypodium distachyon]|uniref:Uncharacterized protein n=1 Tax=Brachypodium distachyon TaxID=15368 RepID=I1GUJ2_BRADI|nr:hypothetical protein BRADI_1g28050v3 [Brachypodium distachyon]
MDANLADAQVAAQQSLVLLVNIGGRVFHVATGQGRPRIGTVTTIGAALLANIRALRNAATPPLYRVVLGVPYLGPAHVVVRLGGEEGVAGAHGNFLILPGTGPGTVVSPDETVVLVGTTNGYQLRIALLSNPLDVYYNICYAAAVAGVGFVLLVSGAASLYFTRRGT